jgi:hypothetical protein
MLLELDTLEVLHLIETPAALADKVCEAVELLKAEEDQCCARKKAAKEQGLATAVATEVHPNAARRRWSLCDTTQPSIALQSTTTQ